MSKSELEEQDSQFTKKSEVAVIGCGEPNGNHSKETQLVAANSFYNGLTMEWIPIKLISEDYTPIMLR